MRTASGTFVLQARSRGDQGAVRIGFTVSKQVGNAVERNRVRRRLREVVSVSATGAGELCPGHDYVLIGRRAALAAPFGEMVKELDAALGRIAALEGGGTGGARPDRLHETGFAVPTASAATAAPQPEAVASVRPSAAARSAEAPELPPQER